MTLRLGALPVGARWSHVAGVGILGGIGFTISLLIAGLAQTADGKAAGEATLRRFLEVAPAEHPGRALAESALDAQAEPEP